MPGGGQWSRGVGNRVPGIVVKPYVLRPFAGSARGAVRALDSLSHPLPRRRRMPTNPAPDRSKRVRACACVPTGTVWRRAGVVVLTVLASAAGDLGGQVLEETLVPRGQLRLQANPVFSTWDRRFGRAADGSTGRERLGEDLTDPRGLAVLPGADLLIDHVRDLTGDATYDPGIGPVEGRLAHDVTRIEFGGHLGVTDWLTVGVVVPWTQTRTALDLNLRADTISPQLGVNPGIADATGVQAYLASLTTASGSAQANAQSVCGGGPGASCTAAQQLADRTAAFLASAEGAYGAAAVFPYTGSPAAGALAAVSSALDADLRAAGMAGITAPMVFASELLTANLLRTLPATSGAGIDGAPLGSRRGLWQTGDVEVSALARLIAVGTPGDRRYARLLGGALVRLGTGAPEEPDVFLDVGTGDGQTDLEGRLIGQVGWGRFALDASVRYGSQRPSTLVKRVAPLEVPVPPLATRASVRWSPGGYIALDAAPSLRLTRGLRLTGTLRYFEKARDRYEWTMPGDASGMPYSVDVLARESGVTVMRVGGGLRYDTVGLWRDGEASRPLEIHVRLVHAIAGGGGHTPVSTRVEAGLRLFRRIWGDSPTP